jgi:hypothetical protein
MLQFPDVSRVSKLTFNTLRLRWGQAFFGTVPEHTRQLSLE